MKKFCALLLSLALAAALALPAAAQEVPVSGAKAVTMVPLRAVAEALGYTVAWDGSLPGARLTLGDREAVLVLGMGYATLLDHGAGGDPVMGISLPMDAAPAMLEKGVMYVPADFFNDLTGGPCVTVSGSAISVEINAAPTGGTVQLPNWRLNLCFAAKWEERMEMLYPGLTRPVLCGYRFYNQDVSPGALLIEIGGHANTVQQAVRAGQYAAKALAALFDGSV